MSVVVGGDNMWLVRRDIQGVGKDFFVKENFASGGRRVVGEVEVGEKWSTTGVWERRCLRI